jgi:hypothetical protein
MCVRMRALACARVRMRARAPRDECVVGCLRRMLAGCPWASAGWSSASGGSSSTAWAGRSRSVANAVSARPERSRRIDHHRSMPRAACTAAACITRRTARGRRRAAGDSAQRAARAALCAPGLERRAEGVEGDAVLRVWRPVGGPQHRRQRQRHVPQVADHHVPVALPCPLRPSAMPRVAQCHAHHVPVALPCPVPCQLRPSAMPIVAQCHAHHVPVALPLPARRAARAAQLPTAKTRTRRRIAMGRAMAQCPRRSRSGHQGYGEVLPRTRARRSPRRPRRRAARATRTRPSTPAATPRRTQALAPDGAGDVRRAASGRRLRQVQRAQPTRPAPARTTPHASCRMRASKAEPAANDAQHGARITHGDERQAAPARARTGGRARTSSSSTRSTSAGPKDEHAAACDSSCSTASSSEPCRVPARTRPT